jgi:hypothetical protein
MTESSTTITRQNVSAPTGGIPRVTRPTISSGVEEIGKTLGAGIVGFLQVKGGEKKANFAFELRKKVNLWALTKNKHEVSKLRDKAIADAGPDGTDILTPEDMVAAQKGIKPEFSPHFTKNADGSITTTDGDKNILHIQPPPEKFDRGQVESGTARIKQGLAYNQKTFPRTAETLKIQLIDPHTPNPRNPDPVQVTKHKALIKASLSFSAVLTTVGKVIERATDENIAEKGTDVSALDPPNRHGRNLDELFIHLNQASSTLEAMNRYSQSGLGGPAQIAPISVFNAMKSEVLKRFIDPQVAAAYGGTKEIRKFLDTLEEDIDASAKDAIKLGADATYSKEAETLAETFKFKRQIEEEARISNWSPEFKDLAVQAPVISALSAVTKILIERNQPKAAGRIAEIISNNALAAEYDSAIRTIDSFSTPNPDPITRIFSAINILSDSLISSYDAERMQRAKKAVESLLANKNIDWSRNPPALEAMEKLKEKVFSGTNMSRANSITPGITSLQNSGGP